MPDRPLLGRYLRTVALLRPGQGVHRVRLRTRQRLLRRWPGAFEPRYRHSGVRAGLPDAFAALDRLVPPDCGPLDDLERGVFSFLGETRDLGPDVAWDPPEASQLWLYHHHYWEWAWTLLQDPDAERARTTFGMQFRSWKEGTQFGRWNAWAPYPTSLRAWVFVNVEAHLARGTSIEAPFHESLRLHAGFVEHNLELDVGGNHLLKNLKALVGLGVYFDDERLVAKATSHVARQLQMQILADGGHFELSPSYHCQVLGDLVDIDSLLATSGRRGPDELGAAIERMRQWLGVMVMPDGDVPLFNDCQRVGVDRIAALQPASPPPGPLTVLADSGYVVARPGPRIHMVTDVGPPCPPDLPAHAHADCLSFELAIDGSRLVVDPGTSIYGSGPRRQWERGTLAHNTLAVDGENQTEVWGGFRAGRRAQATIERAVVDESEVEIVGSHDGYRYLPGAPRHRRTWSVTADGIRIIDVVEGTGVHDIDYRLLLDADQVLEQAGGKIECVAARISVDTGAASGSGCSPMHTENTEYATDQGVVRPAVAVCGRWTVGLPFSLTTAIELTPTDQVGSPPAGSAISSRWAPESGESRRGR